MEEESNEILQLNEWYSESIAPLNKDIALKQNEIEEVSNTLSSENERRDDLLKKSYESMQKSDMNQKKWEDRCKGKIRIGSGCKEWKNDAEIYKKQSESQKRQADEIKPRIEALEIRLKNLREELSVLSLNLQDITSRYQRDIEKIREEELRAKQVEAQIQKETDPFYLESQAELEREALEQETKALEIEKAAEVEIAKANQEAKAKEEEDKEAKKAKNRIFIGFGVIVAVIVVIFVVRTT